MKTLVIVANSARARIFSTQSLMRGIEEIEGFAHPEAHLINQELVSDSPGRSVDGRGTLDPRTTAREQEDKDFAKLLARHLKELHNQQHFEQLVLAASPHFLGLLRNQLPSPLDDIVSQTVDKNLTDASVEQILEYLRS